MKIHNITLGICRDNAISRTPHCPGGFRAEQIGSIGYVSFFGIQSVSESGPNTSYGNLEPLPILFSPLHHQTKLEEEEENGELRCHCPPKIANPKRCDLKNVCETCPWQQLKSFTGISSILLLLRCGLKNVC